MRVVFTVVASLDMFTIDFSTVLFLFTLRAVVSCWSLRRMLQNELAFSTSGFLSLKLTFLIFLEAFNFCDQNTQYLDL